LETPSVTLRTATSGGFISRTTLDVVVWLARKDSNLRSPDPEMSDLNQLRQRFSELNLVARAVKIGECQTNTLRRVMRTAEFVCESSELMVLARLYDETVASPLSTHVG
jgi:hypothetical protein